MSEYDSIVAIQLLPLHYIIVIALAFPFDHSGLSSICIEAPCSSGQGSFSSVSFFDSH